MSLLTALFLGLIQGLTEFFPVSSSAHLDIARALMGIKSTSHTFNLACHMGTLLSLVWFFKSEVAAMLRSDRKKLLYLALALLPLAPSYFLLSHARTLLSNTAYMGSLLMITGAILLAGEKIRIQKRGSMLRDTLLIGALQSCALIPGISRSASTISCAQVLGWSRREAIHFSFLLAIPTTVCGSFVQVGQLVRAGQLQNTLNLECFIGFAVAAFVGFAVIKLAMRILEKGKLSSFAWYCMVTGGLTQLLLSYAK